MRTAMSRVFVIRMKIIDLNDCNVGSGGGRYDTKQPSLQCVCRLLSQNHKTLLQQNAWSPVVSINFENQNQKENLEIVLLYVVATSKNFLHRFGPFHGKVCHLHQIENGYPRNN